MVDMTRTPTSVATAPAHSGTRVGPENEPSGACGELREEGVELRRGVDGKGDRVVATRAFATGDTVMIGFLIEASTENDSHATQIGPDRWARHGGLGPMVNHSCDPNCGVRLNDRQAFDFVARKIDPTGRGNYV